MLVRWKLQLLEYDCKIIYKKGSQNVVADALSRIVVELKTLTKLDKLLLIQKF